MHGEIYSFRVRESNVVRPREARFPYRLDRITVVLSGDLRLTDNAAHAMSQLQALENRLRLASPTELYVDLSQVTSIDAPALLFLTSRVDALRRNPYIRPNGNFPLHPAARQALNDANFERWLSRKAYRAPVHSSGHLELYVASRHRDRVVRPSVANAIQEFLVGQAEGLKAEEKMMLGWAVSEALENVRTHAYDVPPERGGWQAVGLYNRERGIRSVAVVDVGVGILATAKRGHSTLLSSSLDRLELATRGLLTASGDPKNGKGLSSLVDFCTAAAGRRLHVLSSGGRIVWSSAQVPTKVPIPTVRGTIVCLEIEDGVPSSRVP